MMKMSHRTIVGATPFLATLACVVVVLATEAEALPNGCVALDYSGTFEELIEQGLYYYYGRDGTEEGMLNGFANSTLSPIREFRAAPPAAGQNAFLMNFDANSTADYESAMCYGCDDSLHPVLSCVYTGAATLELRPTKVSADCKVVSMVGLELQPGTPGCKIGDCAPYIETISFDRTDDNYEGEVFDVAIPPPSLAVDGCDTLSYSGAYDRRISHGQYLPLNGTSISALPGPQLLAQTFEAPSSAAAADVGDGAFVVYNDGSDGEPFVLCLRRTVAFAGDLACVKIEGPGKVIFAPVAVDAASCRVTHAAGIVTEPRAGFKTGQEPSVFEASITAAAGSAPAPENEALPMSTSPGGEDGCAAYNFAGSFSQNLTYMVPNAEGDDVEVQTSDAITDVFEIKEGEGGDGSYFIPDILYLLCTTMPLRTGSSIEDTIVECASTDSRATASIYPTLVDEATCDVLEANVIILAPAALGCDDITCEPFVESGTFSRA